MKRRNQWKFEGVEVIHKTTAWKFPTGPSFHKCKHRLAVYLQTEHMKISKPYEQPYRIYKKLIDFSDIWRKLYAIRKAL